MKRKAQWVLIGGSLASALVYLGVAARDALAVFQRAAAPGTLDGLGITRYILILTAAAFAAQGLRRGRALPRILWPLMAFWVVELVPGAVWCALAPDSLCALPSIMLWKGTTLAAPLLYVVLVFLWNHRAFRICSASLVFVMAAGTLAFQWTAPAPAATPAGCDRLKNDVERRDCYTRLAVEREDVALCATMANLPDEEGAQPPELVRSWREGCEREIYIKHGDPALCSSLQGWADRDICFSDIAERRREPTLCANIRDATHRARCKEWASHSPGG